MIWEHCGGGEGFLRLMKGGRSIFQGRNESCTKHVPIQLLGPLLLIFILQNNKQIFISQQSASVKDPVGRIQPDPILNITSSQLDGILGIGSGRPDVILGIWKNYSPPNSANQVMYSREAEFE
jgi:hypothetical protein